MSDVRTFSLFIHSERSRTPNLAFVVAGDEVTVRMMAFRALKESPDRFLVEVREGDRLLFTLDREGTPHRIVLQPANTDDLRDSFPPSSEAQTLH